MGEDLAVTYRLPEEYQGVTVKRDPGRKTLTLKANFMGASFEPVSSSDPPCATLAKWWDAMSKSIRDSFDHKAIPEDLKAAIKGRSRLFASTVEESPDLVDLVAEAPDVGAQARDLGGNTRPAKRSRQPVFRHRRVRPRQAKSNPTMAYAGVCYPCPGLVGVGVAFPERRWTSSSGSVGAVCEFTEEKVRRLKPLLQRLLERL